MLNVCIKVLQEESRSEDHNIDPIEHHNADKRSSMLESGKAAVSGELQKHSTPSDSASSTRASKSQDMGAEEVSSQLCSQLEEICAQVEANVGVVEELTSDLFSACAAASVETTGSASMLLDGTELVTATVATPPESNVEEITVTRTLPKQKQALTDARDLEKASTSRERSAESEESHSRGRDSRTGGSWWTVKRFYV